MTTFDLSALDTPYKEAFAFFEGFRRLGFSADGIFLVLAGPDGFVQVNVALQRQDRYGGKGEVLGTAGYVAASKNEISHVWATLCRAINERRVPLNQLHEAWDNSIAKRSQLELIGVLRDKGIEIPVETRGDRSARSVRAGSVFEGTRGDELVNALAGKGWN